ncbi:hypothetical protein Vafri_18224 [Volvox africanus]|uniref:Uncharacterized protein n=1 Tax=Volvox africanus TaxID=51714 RepID=A0A8J4BNY7_9CHLO|nr:hypothetical protein Vafri_18224 [Volvox africanus]
MDAVRSLSAYNKNAQGGLPTFLDVGQSFSAAAISEDNLLAQMHARGMRVVVMGDDTWAQLAPLHYYAACHPYPAFNVRDLHTVDDGVWQVRGCPLLHESSSKGDRSMHFRQQAGAECSGLTVRHLAR